MATSSPAGGSKPSSSDVTQLLQAWRRGDSGANERLLSAIYVELHRQAERAMRREASEHTLQATALVNEAYLRLAEQRRVEWLNRAQFFGVAAHLMRRVLVDHARGRLAAKRGGALVRVTLGAAESMSPRDEESVDVSALHDALEHLATFDPLQAQLVELRYFGGLTIEETATALDRSPATIKREWAIARAWLRRELSRT